MQKINRQQLAIEKLKTINTYLSMKVAMPDRDINLSITSGTVGLCLYFYEYGRYTKNDISKKNFKVTLTDTYNVIETSDLLEASFSAGITGWGWLIEHTRNESKVDHLVSNEINDVLDEQLDAYLLKNNYDFLHGALGIGIYFLKRKDSTRAKKIVRALYNSCIMENGEGKWKRFDKFNHQADLYDFGFAHGVIGILAFLIKCYQRGICRTIVKELLKKGFLFYMNNIQQESNATSIFPNKVLIAAYQAKKDMTLPAMQGWCYGDLGTCLVLLKIARLLKNKADEEIVVGLLHRIAKRRVLDDKRIVDAGFCHGASGIAYLYLKICNLIDDNIMENELKHWIDLLLSPNAVKGNSFEFYLGPKYGWGEVTGLLNGTAGVGLVLLEYINRSNSFNSSWEECLLL